MKKSFLVFLITIRILGVSNVGAVVSEPEYTLILAEERDYQIYQERGVYDFSSSPLKIYRSGYVYIGESVNYDLVVNNYEGEINLSLNFSGAQEIRKFNVSANSVYQIEVLIGGYPNIRNYTAVYPDNFFPGMLYKMVDITYDYNSFKFSANINNKAMLSYTAVLPAKVMEIPLKLGISIDAVTIFDQSGEEVPSYIPQDGPSEWAVADIDRAVDSGLISADLQNRYVYDIKRRDLANVLVAVLRARNTKYFTDFQLANGGPSYDRPFVDVNDNSVSWLYHLGISDGVGYDERSDGGKYRYFAPDECITRQEAATMIYRACCTAFGMDDNGKETDFADQSQISDWAVNGVNFVVSNELMEGIGDNCFDPMSNITKEQAYVLMLRLYDFWENAVTIPPFWARAEMVSAHIWLGYGQSMLFEDATLVLSQDEFISFTAYFNRNVDSAIVEINGDIINSEIFDDSSDFILTQYLPLSEGAHTIKITGFPKYGGPNCVKFATINVIFKDS